MSNRLPVVAILGTVFALAALSGCDRKTEYNGIGYWVFGKSTYSDVAPGHCSKQAGVVWCGNDPLDARRAVDLGGQNGIVGLYFAHEERASPLIEIVIDVRPCDGKRLGAFMENKFGKPTAVKGVHHQWRFKHMFMQARLPPDDVCQLSAVQANNAKRIAELDAKATAK